MLQKTKGIVLRAFKYGETSLVVTLFTADQGVQAFMVQGVRKTTKGSNKASYFQPGMLLDLVMYMQPGKNINRLREYQAGYMYTDLHGDVVKNSILLFCTEIMLRLLPEHAPLPELFDFASDFFPMLDSMPVKQTANMPLFFLVQCSRLLGYEPRGRYTTETPHLDLQQGGFSEHTPVLAPFTSDEDARALNAFLETDDYVSLKVTAMSSDMRLRLIDWYISYLQQHTQHLGNVRSLQILRVVLHQ
jgi:DNA repair protein RecO (recombination protein O)